MFLTFEEIVTDKNKLAKIAIMFMQDSNTKFRNLRFLIDFFSFIEICGNTDKTYLYSPILCENKSATSYMVLNVIGFSKSKIVELILNRETLKYLDEDLDMNKYEIIDVIAYGGKIKNTTIEKNISFNKIFEIKDFIIKI